MLSAAARIGAGREHQGCARRAVVGRIRGRSPTVAGPCSATRGRIRVVSKYHLAPANAVQRDYAPMFSEVPVIFAGFGRIGA